MTNLGVYLWPYHVGKACIDNAWGAPASTSNKEIYAVVRFGESLQASVDAWKHPYALVGLRASAIWGSCRKLQTFPGNSKRFQIAPEHSICLSSAIFRSCKPKTKQGFSKTPYLVLVSNAFVSKPLFGFLVSIAIHQAMVAKRSGTPFICIATPKHSQHAFPIRRTRFPKVAPDAISH